jgi:predicted transcriptional regulator of viral defense system
MDPLGVTRLLEDHRTPVVTAQQLATLLDMDQRSASVKLHRLARDRALVRVMRGRYCLPSVHPICVASGIYSPSYVSLLMAFQYHGTTTQSPRAMDVINTVRSGALDVELDAGRYAVRFIKLSSALVYGHDRVSIGGKEAMVASKERAVVDGLLLPGRVPLDETVECLRSGIEVSKVVDYARRTGRQVVIKRLGHLLSEEGLDFDAGQLGEVTGTYVPIDPAFPRRGRYDSRWRVIVNRVVE